MAISLWNDEFNSGIEQIDHQHQKLFKLFNAFEEEYDSKAPPSVIVAFFENFSDYCSEHFMTEEKLMEDNKYPLVDIHKNAHNVFRQNMGEILKVLQKSILDNQHNEIIDFFSRWQYHVAREDVMIFQYLQNKSFHLDKRTVGRPCEISTLDNDLLSYGHIADVTDDSIIITCSNKYIQLWFNDVVKISMFTQDNKFLCFVSKVYFKKEAELSLFKGTLIKASNNRRFFRIPAKIDALMSSPQADQVPITILDISAGGILVETEMPMSLDDEVLVEFTFHNYKFIANCKAARFLKKNAKKNQFGMMFIDMKKNMHNELMKLLLHQQALNLKESKK